MVTTIPVSIIPVIYIIFRLLDMTIMIGVSWRTIVIMMDLEKAI